MGIATRMKFKGDAEIFLMACEGGFKILISLEGDAKFLIISYFL